MSLDVRLLAILDPTLLGDRDPVAAARAAVVGGATLVQLRHKTAGAGDVLHLARELVAALPVPVYVNDRVDVAVAAGAAGVHLGQEDLDPRRARALAPPGFGIGISVGTAEEARGVAAAPVDYWSVGSVYATPTKPDAGLPIEPQGFRNLARLAPRGMPVIAIGGITDTNASVVLAAGAQGIAVISAIFAADDIETAARRLRRLVDAAARPPDR